MMATLLNCWASNGEGNAVCKGFENELKSCMASYKPGGKDRLSSINYHTTRLYPKLKGKQFD
jgi:hypothetical protein